MCVFHLSDDPIAFITYQSNNIFNRQNGFLLRAYLENKF